MQSIPVRKSASALAFALAGAAVVLVLRAMSGPETAAPVDRAAETVERVAAVPADATPAAGEGDAEIPLRSSSAQPPAASNPNPHVEALRHPSELYRITSLTAVIQEAGYLCRSVLSATAGTDDMSAWRVSCEGAHAYFVSEDDSGRLHVEPIAFFEVPRITPVPRIELPRSRSLPLE